MKTTQKLLFAVVLGIMPGLLAAQEGGRQAPTRPLVPNTVDTGGGLDPARIHKGATDAWPTYSGDYSGKRYSPLMQITQANGNSPARTASADSATQRRIIFRSMSEGFIAQHQCHPTKAALPAQLPRHTTRSKPDCFDLAPPCSKSTNPI